MTAEVALLGLHGGYQSGDVDAVHESSWISVLDGVHAGLSYTSVPKKKGPREAALPESRLSGRCQARGSDTGVWHQNLMRAPPITTLKSSVGKTASALKLR
jgi:hypothetical protein